MYRATLYLSIVLASIVLITGQTPAQAEMAVSARDRYAGLFLAEQRNDTLLYWYVDAESRERYAISNGSDFSRLLKHRAVTISAAKLDLIPRDAADRASAVALQTAAEFKGKFVRRGPETGSAWYVFPLDGARYEVADGADGFEVMKGLAIDIREERLQHIPITKMLGFNYFKLTSSEQSDATKFDLNLYRTVFEFLREQHLHKDTFTDDDLFYGSLEGMARGTKDANTEFYSPEKHQTQQRYFAGDLSLEGIGAVLGERDNGIIIISVLEHTPAASAGLQSKDRILNIDTVSTEKMSVNRAVSLIKGPKGTPVTLTIYRESTGVTQDYRIIRDVIEIPVVTARAMENGVAYFNIHLFTTNLIHEFNELRKKFITSSTRGLIIDLRNNPGGITTAALDLADLWIAKGDRIISERKPGFEVIFVGGKDPEIPAIPTVVLVNEETGSSSEIVAAALQHYQLAKIIGVTTHGKGTGQTLLNFEDGSGLKFTTFEWVPPNGVSIDGTGLNPDIVVEQKDLGDTQLERAKAYLLYGN